MANGETVNDLHMEILEKCGEKADGSSDYHDRALQYLNKCYQKIIAGACEFDLDLGEPWIWAISQNKLVLTLLPMYNTGTVSFIYGSTSGTFSTIPKDSAGNNISLLNYWVNLGFTGEWYQITAHTSGTTTFTIDTTFNDSTVTGGSFMAIPIDYTIQSSSTSEMGGIQRLAGPLEVYRAQTFDNDNEYRIYGTDIREFKRLYPLPLIQLGVPTRFAFTAQTDGVFKIRVNKYNTVATRVDVPYIPVPIDMTSEPDSIPVLPREFRDCLVYGPAYWLCTDKNDNRSQEYLGRTKDILKSMIMDSRKKRDHIQKQKGALVPRLDLVNQKKRIPYF